MLANNSQDIKDKLFEDLAFLHEIAIPEMWPHAVRLFIEKWSDEVDMCAYLEKEILHRKFSRCHSAPGKPTDNNTGEAFNRVVKVPLPVMCML